MMLDRRLFLFSLTSALTAGAAFAEEAFIPRIGGEVTATNFAGLSNLAMDSVDQFVGLKIAFPAGDHEGLVGEETNGLLIVYRKGGDVQLSFPSGYRQDQGKFFLDGFYQVKYEGLHQGINAVSLTPARTMDVEASGKPVKMIAIDKLPVEAN